MNNMLNKNSPPSPMKARDIPFNTRRSDLDFGRGSDNDGINITQSQAPAEEMLKSNEVFLTTPFLVHITT